MKKAIAIVLLTGVLISGGYIVASKNDTSDDLQAIAQSIENIQTEQGRPVQVEIVAQQDIKVTQTFYGSVTPYAQAKVQGKHGGSITFLKGEEGDSVRAGDAIVKFDDSDTQLQFQQAIAGKNAALQSVKQAQSNFETLQTTLNRYQKLFKDGLIPRQNLDEMLNQLQVAQAGLGSAREQVKNADAQIQLLQNTLSNMKITAPISGVIDEKHFNLYEIAKPGETIYHVVDIEHVYIEVDIPESYISQIREQMEVSVLYDSLKGQEFPGYIERIMPTGDPQRRNFIAKVLVNNPELTVNPDSLKFGPDLFSLEFIITNTGTGTLTWTITDNYSWLGCSRYSGTTMDEADTLTVMVNRSWMDPGEHHGEIVITSDGGTDTVCISMEVVVEDVLMPFKIGNWWTFEDFYENGYVDR